MNDIKSRQLLQNIPAGEFYSRAEVYFGTEWKVSDLYILKFLYKSQFYFDYNNISILNICNFHECFIESSVYSFSNLIKINAQTGKKTYSVSNTIDIKNIYKLSNNI